MKQRRVLMHWAASAVALALSGCGGGGGGGGTVFLPGAVPAPPAAPAPAPAEQPGEPRASVVLYGDSIMAGESMVGPLKERPVDILRTLIRDIDFESRAMPGQTANNAAILFAHDGRTADVVVIQYGVNDLQLGLDPVPAIDAMVVRALGEGRRVVLTGMTRVDHPLYASTSARIRDIAAVRNVAYAGWDGIEIVTVDGTHPDQKSTFALCEALALAIEISLAAA